jgi:hypothetical protein
MPQPGGKSEMREKTISTKDELFAVIQEYENKGFYFRGENRDYEEKKTACVPSCLRNGNCTKLNLDRAQKILEDLGVGFPYISPRDDSTMENIISALGNADPWRFLPWREEQLKALMQHYTPDFKALKSLGPAQLPGCSSYLDITPDINVALHFSCSEYQFLSEDKAQEPAQSEPAEDGFLFVFDLKELENTRFLKLVSYPSYSYFCQNEDRTYFQPFNRITHQCGAFLAPRGNISIEFSELKEEIRTQIHTKVIIKNSVKKELYELFGGKKGLDYYFPKIPCTFLQNNNAIQQEYQNLRGVTVFV